MQILLYATSVLSFVRIKNGVATEIVKVTGWGIFMALGWGILMAPPWGIIMALNQPNVGNCRGPRHLIVRRITSAPLRTKAQSIFIMSSFSINFTDCFLNALP